MAAVPMNKHTQIEELLTELNGGKNRRAYIRADQCVRCGGPAKFFDNELSRTEYAISGWCQICQNEFFDDSSTEGM